MTPDSPPGASHVPTVPAASQATSAVPANSNTAAATAQPRLYALVPCAGTGSRAGTALPKQYAPVAGQPLVAHTLAALARVPRLTATLVVLAPDDDQFERRVPGFAGDRAWAARVGGASRAETVAGGLAALQARCAWRDGGQGR